MLSIQNLSVYQMQIQSCSSKVNDLSGSSNSSSFAMASALKQQISSLQGKLNAAKSSNESNLSQDSADNAYFEKKLYNNNAQLQQFQQAQNAAFDVYA